MVKELSAKGVRAEAFRADQANTKEVEGLVEAVVKRFGKSRHPGQQCRRVRLRPGA